MFALFDYRERGRKKIRLWTKELNASFYTGLDSKYLWPAREFSL